MADSSEEGEAMGDILILVKLVLTVVKLLTDITTSIIKLIRAVNKEK